MRFSQRSLPRQEYLRNADPHVLHCVGEDAELRAILQESMD